MSNRARRNSRAGRGIGGTVLVAALALVFWGASGGLEEVEGKVGELASGFGISDGVFADGVFADGASSDSSGDASGAASAEFAASGVDAEAARSRLDSLEVGYANVSGYDREAWPHWSDATDSGFPPTINGQEMDSCDSRDAALVRDGEGVTVEDSSGYCSIESGSWTDPYSGASAGADSSEVDIDHIVPLANAYASGGRYFSEAEREAYANDPDVLVASDSSVNTAKSDSAPQEWMPPDEGAHCGYAARWIEIKADYGMSITAAEKNALGAALDTCSA